MQPRVSVAPFRGLVRFGLYPEFRFAPLRALFPLHPPGAVVDRCECDRAKGPKERSPWFRRTPGCFVGWARMADTTCAKGPKECGPWFRRTPDCFVG
jgi:hypothetical protein